MSEDAKLNPVAAPFIPKGITNPDKNPQAQQKSPAMRPAASHSPAMMPAVPKTPNNSFTDCALDGSFGRNAHNNYKSVPVVPRAKMPTLPMLPPFIPPFAGPMPPPFPMIPPGVPPMGIPPMMPSVPHQRPRPIVVLVVGDACAGKTTLCERLAKDHNLMVFCGAHVLNTAANQTKPEWEKRALVIESIESMIKDVYSPNTSFRGVVIDRQGKTVDDMHYLNAMMRKNQWHLSAIYCCRVKDDAILVTRMKERESSSALAEHTIAERIRASRLLVERCRELFGVPGLWHDIDCSGRLESVSKHLKNTTTSVMLAQQQGHGKSSVYPTPPAPPGESRFLRFVDDVREYADTVSKLFRLLQKDRLNKYPGTAVGRHLNGEESAALLTTITPNESSYVFRQVRDGTPYLMFHTASEKIYFVPRHLRCLYHVDLPVFKKHKLRDFVLDGELVSDHSANFDVYYATDCLVAQSKVCIRREWAERQKYISDCMIPAEDKFSPLSGRLTFLRQLHVTYDGLKDLVARPNTRGIVMNRAADYHPGVDERMLCWHRPDKVCVDLRVRKVEVVCNDDVHSLRRLHLDSLDLDGEIARYVDAGVTVDVTDPMVVVSYGHIVEVAFDWTADRKCTFRRVRYDRAISDNKRRLEAAMTKVPLSADDFMAFATQLKVQHDQDCKRISYQGEDVVKRLLELKHAPQAKVTEVPCKFFAKGKCRSGDSCPYLHLAGNNKMPTVALQLSDIEQRKPETCAECAKVAPGRTDEDGAFYCLACWQSYETGGGADAASKKKRRPKKKTN
eukprot:PhM_4_TR8443/c0_g1_i1/m.51307